MIASIALLLACQFAGEIIRLATGVPLPGAIIGMALLFCWLYARPGARPALEQVAAWLIAHMTIMFLPAAVGLMDEGLVLRRHGVAILVATIASTLLTIAVSAAVFHFVAARTGRPS